MDKIEKFLRKLDPKELARLVPILEKVKQGKLSGLNVKKLKGQSDIFRVRTGDIRIVFMNHKGVTRVIFIERRSEDTKTHTKTSN